MRQVFCGASSFNQFSFSSFWLAFIEPSTCAASQTSLVANLSLATSCFLYSSTTAENMLEIFLELTLLVFEVVFCGSITWQKATPRRIGFESSVKSSLVSCFERAFQQPIILAASSTLSALFSSFNKCCRRSLTCCESTAKTITL